MIQPLRPAITIVLMPGPWGGAAELSPEQAEQLRKAQQRIEADEPAAAATMLEALLEQRPTLAEAHRVLGHARLQLDQARQARAAFVQSIAHGRITADVLAALARIDRRADRPAAAAASLQGLAMLDPGRVDHALLRAQMRLEAGALGAARAAVRRVTDRAPASAEAWRLRANIELRAGQTGAARRAMITADWLGARDAESARAIAELHHQAGAIDPAIAWYKRAMERRDEPPARWRLRQAELLLAAGRHEAAYDRLQALRDAEGVDPAQVLRWLGHAAKRMGRAAEAARAWRQAADHGLRDPSILRFLVAHALETDDPDALTQHLPMLEAGGATDQTTTRLIVRGRLNAGQPDRAVAAVQRYVAAHGMNPTARALLERIAASHDGEDQ